MSKPDPNSIQGRIREFFKANPEEWLTRVDLCEKFGLTNVQADSAINSLKGKGVLESAHIYRVKR